MIETEIEAILREFDPIHRQIAQAEGKDAIVVSGVPTSAEDTPDPAPNDLAAIAFFCSAAQHMLSAGHGFPDSQKYVWIADPQRYRNSFEAMCQDSIVNLLIGLWEHRGYRCDKIVVARNEHTGGYQIETYETANAYFACISYQFSNLINRYSLLNHYVIEVGQQSEPLQCLTPTNEVGGEAIERAIRTRWSEICPHLDAFLTTVAKASAYESSEVLLNKHVAAAKEQFYTSENYVHLRDAKRLLAGPFYLAAEVMWTMYSDQVLQFTLAHELMHIHKGDLRKPGRNLGEETGADMGATDLLGYMTVSTARRQGYQPSIANIIMGPIIFFALSRVFAYFDNFEGKYSAKKLSEASMAEAMKEELTLLQRSICLAGLLAGGGWLIDPGAAPFWNITGELRLLEIALRRRLWEMGGVPLSLPVEAEIVLLQNSIQATKCKTEKDVAKLRQEHEGSKT
jgi:hypothetical protein